MALGQILTGHPWLGVLIATALFCACTYWMLLGWLPPVWALTGGLLATTNFGPLHRWAESYWGGAVAALGGAIVLGAIPRFYRNPTPLHPVILVAGWGLIWFTRPYEAAVCALLLVPFILYPLRRASLLSAVKTIAPALVVGIGLAAFFLYYNFRVTGSAWTMPYQLYRNQYGVPQTFLWQDMISGPIPAKKNIADDFYWQQKQYIESKKPASFVRNSLDYAYLLWILFGGYVGRGIPLLLLLWPQSWRSNRLIPILLGFLAIAFLASLLYPFHLPHYLAHYAALVLLLLLFSLQQVFSWRWKSYPVGPIIVTTLLITSVLHKLHAPEPYSWHLDRAALLSRLEKTPEKHLIFVQYSPSHNFHEEWVYNAADIDNSPVVWAQPLDPASDAALIRYFAGRKVWNLHPDAPNRPLTPLQ
jgi:hypothetical protein